MTLARVFTRVAWALGLIHSILELCNSDIYLCCRVILCAIGKDKHSFIVIIFCAFVLTLVFLLSNLCTQLMCLYKSNLCTLYRHRWCL